MTLNSKLKIVADENIPHVETIFGHLGELTTAHGRHLDNALVKEADVLLVRSVTNVNEALLADSKVRFVGSSTIGVDHLDTEYLDKKGITYTSAPGCNAWAVVQYVVSVLASLDLIDGEQSKKQKRVCVVGGGNVGGRVYDTLSSLGFECKIYDPFLDASCGRKLTEFESVYDADIVCLHAPLTHHSEFPTHHMFDADVIERIKGGALLINAGRGAVIENQALLNALSNGKKLSVVLDVWENEPYIMTQLFPYVLYATPHIAGYSLEGRCNGAVMVYEKLLNFLNASIDEGVLKNIQEQVFGNHQTKDNFDLKESILSAYDVRADNVSLREAEKTLPEGFDLLRKNYPLRREFSHYAYKNISTEYQSVYKSLRFKNIG